MPSLKKVREEAWEFYQEWRKEKTYSPALKSEIRVVLIEDKLGNKIFYSVMDRRTKNETNSSGNK